MNVIVRVPARTVILWLAVVAVGCGNPLWKYDRYVVDGSLLGTTCRATIDGRPFVGDVAGLGNKTQFVEEASPPRRWKHTALVCRGLVLEFLSRAGTLPERGRYRIVSGAIDTTSVNVHIEQSHIDAGRWPFAYTGVHLEGTDGFLQLEEMTDSTARGTFHAVVRRQPNGE